MKAVALAGARPTGWMKATRVSGGGRPGVSDAYRVGTVRQRITLLRVASAGFLEVNLHGGGVGDLYANRKQRPRCCGPAPRLLRMQLAQQFAGLAVTPCEAEMEANATCRLRWNSSELRGG